MLVEMTTNCRNVMLGPGFRDGRMLWPSMEDMLVKCAASNNPWCPRTRLGEMFERTKRCMSHYYGALTPLSGCHSLQSTKKGLSGVAVHGCLRNKMEMEWI